MFRREPSECAVGNTSLTGVQANWCHGNDKHEMEGNHDHNAG